jgi:1,4-alpha-glucan branching enzyme
MTTHPPSDDMFWIGRDRRLAAGRGQAPAPLAETRRPSDHDGGQAGVAFAVWAPAARWVGLSGDFNGWQPQAMRLRPECGVWELFVPGAGVGAWYKFQVRVPTAARS